MKYIYIQQSLFFSPCKIKSDEEFLPNRENITILYFEKDFEKIKQIFSRHSLSDPEVYLNLLIRLEKNFAENFNMKLELGRTGIPLKRLYSEFRKITGVTPVNYLITLRVYKAAFLLLNTTIPAEKIAYDCGIATLSNYRMLMRKYFGKSPSEIRIHNSVILSKNNHFNS